jgi:hypothetical protein
MSHPNPFFAQTNFVPLVRWPSPANPVQQCPQAVYLRIEACEGIEAPDRTASRSLETPRSAADPPPGPSFIAVCPPRALSHLRLLCESRIYRTLRIMVKIVIWKAQTCGCGREFQ